jgi:hypothetical protein
MFPTAIEFVCQKDFPGMSHRTESLGSYVVNQVDSQPTRCLVRQFAIQPIEWAVNQ